MSEMKRNRRGQSKHNQTTQQKHNVKDIDEKSPVIQLFRKFQVELDERHDKYERIVKLSRDITIESKRIIFQLHRISGSPNPDEILTEAGTKVKEIQHTKWKGVARELYNEDPHRFLRAYSPGLQEYIEAVSFLFYLKEKTLIGPGQVERELCYEINKTELTISEEPPVDKASQLDPQNENIKVTDADTEPKASSKVETISETKTSPSSEIVTISVFVPPIEYMLGVADLTGELMRMAINSVGSGELDTPVEVCQFMRLIHDAFVMFGKLHREIPRKLHTLTQSLKKVENACYTLQVRGSEIPKHMLKDVFTNNSAVDMPQEFEDMT